MVTYMGSPNLSVFDISACQLVLNIMHIMHEFFLGGEMMGELVRQTLADIMQIAAEKIALGENPEDFISVWAEIAEGYGEL